jgi:hypothetical protein
MSQKNLMCFAVQKSIDYKLKEKIRWGCSEVNKSITFQTQHTEGSASTTQDVEMILYSLL